MNTLLEIDQSLLLLLNKLHSPFLDELMIRTTKWRWAGSGYVLLMILVSKGRGWKEWIWIALGIVLVVLLTDQITSSLMKPLIERLRPCRIEALQHLLYTPVGCAGWYGFPSGHATTSFGLSFYLHRWPHLKGKWPWLLYAYAVCVSYSRIYVGVHYPIDIICGASIGLILGYIVCVALQRLQGRMKINTQT